MKINYSTREAAQAALDAAAAYLIATDADLAKSAEAGETAEMGESKEWAVHIEVRMAGEGAE